MELHRSHGMPIPSLHIGRSPFHSSAARDSTRRPRASPVRSAKVVYAAHCSKLQAWDGPPGLPPEVLISPAWPFGVWVELRRFLNY